MFAVLCGEPIRTLFGFFSKEWGCEVRAARVRRGGARRDPAGAEAHEGRPPRRGGRDGGRGAATREGGVRDGEAP